MRAFSLSLGLLLVVIMLAGCAGTSPQSPELITPQYASTSEVTLPAPTAPSGSTPIPWWGGVIPLVFPGRQLVGKSADLAVVPDGTIYLTDIKYQSILHLDSEGNILHKWGSFSGADQTQPAPTGTFNEPWGIAVAPDGSIYVADTWNHRVQVFTATGEFLQTWGQFGQGTDPFGLFGPRDIAIGSNGFVYISDTGNKRIVAYTTDGEYVTQIGGEGNQPGQFVEPVGIAFSDSGELYVADEGNHRVQVFYVGEDGVIQPKTAWSVDAWPQNEALYKPFICVVGDRVYISDTQAGAVLEYSTSGDFRNNYDLNNTGYLNYGLVYGIASDAKGTLWVSDNPGGAPIIVNIIPFP